VAARAPQAAAPSSATARATSAVVRAPASARENAPSCSEACSERSAASRACSSSSNADDRLRRRLSKATPTPNGTIVQSSTTSAPPSTGSRAACWATMTTNSAPPISPTAAPGQRPAMIATTIGTITPATPVMPFHP